MTTERLAGRDKRLIAAALLAIAACVWYTRSNFQAAFPEASIDLRYSKEEITRQAASFLRGQGLSTAGFRNLTLFDPDEEARLYLERELGLETANRLMSAEVPVWRWRARWFRPPGKEEMLVYLSPAGKLVGFEHRVREDAPGARLGRDEARALAARFLAAYSKAAHKPVEEQLLERPNRYDYVFTWEQDGFKAKDARCRRTVLVQGGRVGRYFEFLYVPERWKRDFAALRSKNELYTQMAMGLYVPLVVAAAGALLYGFRRKLLRWRGLLIIAGVVGVLMVLNEWNALPFFIDGTSTSSPYHESLLLGVLQGLGAGAGVFFYVILAAAAGEPLFRRSQPGRLSLLAIPSRRAIRTREFFTSAVVGYGFAAVHIAFVVAFYTIGRRFGVWSPQDVQYSDLLSTRLPWLYPLTISLLAATSEEFWFRLFAIPLLKKVLRSTWLAVVIPAFVWGFLHANYPQQPAYIRGLEVGIIGVAAGFLMLRFGILATLVWHYTVDAILIGMFLFRAGNWYFQLSGWLVGAAVLFPLLVSVVHYVRRGGFEVVPEALNPQCEAGEAAAGEPARTGPALAPLARRWAPRWLFAAAVAGCLALVLFQPLRYGDFIRVRLTSSQAQDIAAREVRGRGGDPAAWRRTTTFLPNLHVADFEYVRRLAGDRAAAETVRQRTHTGYWLVRYFQPLRKEEWRIFVDQAGRVIRTDHLLPEDAPGASLTPERALALAEKHLAAQPGLQGENQRLVDSGSENRARRADHVFVWEDSSFRMGDAKARATVNVLGDEVSGFDRYLKLPEQWQREFERPRLQGVLLPGAAGAMGLYLLLVLVRRLSARSSETGGHRYHWRAYSTVAALAGAAALAAAFNRLPAILMPYNTAQPLESFVGQVVLGRAIAVLLATAGGFLGTLALDVFLQMTVGERALPAPAASRAFPVAAVLAGFVGGLAYLRQAIPGPRYSLPLWELPGGSTYMPAISVLSQGFLSALTAVTAAGSAVCASVRFLHGRGRGLLVLCLALVVALGSAQTAPQAVFAFLAVLLFSGVVMLVVNTCAGDLISIGVGLFWFEIAGPVAALVSQPAPFFRWNGVAAGAAALALGLLAIRRYGRLDPMRGPLPAEPVLASAGEGSPSTRDAGAAG